MTKEEDKLPLNTEEDLTLPNLEEGLNIEEIPSIEDLISLDKEEIEKIQETEIANVFKSNEDTSGVFEDNIDLSPDINTGFTEQNHQFDASLDSNFDNMNLFDEDTPLTLDEPPAFEHNFDNDLSFDEEPEISEETSSDNDSMSGDLPDLNISDEPVINFDEQQDIFAQDEIEMPEIEEDKPLETDNEQAAAEQEQEEHIHDSIDEPVFEMPALDENFADDSQGFSFQDEFTSTEDTNPVVEQEEAILDEQENYDMPADSEENEPELSENTENSDEQTEHVDDSVMADASELPEVHEISEDTLIHDEHIPEETPKHTRTTEDVFAKIDSLLNDDSAFESGKTTPQTEPALEFTPVEEMPKPKYRSTFNPAKYMRKNRKTENTAEIAEREEKLGILYAARKVLDNIKNFSEELSAGDNPSIAEMLNSETGKKALVTAAVCVVVLGAGIGGVTLLNNKSVEEIETISKNDVSTPLESPAAQQNEQPVQPAETTPAAAPLIDEKANVSADAPDINQIEKPQLTVKQDVIKEEVQKQVKQQNPESYLTVKKIQWQVPDYLSYSPNIKSYLQAAGKSIKLGLSSDLLLTTEYAYSNVVKVNLKLNNSGAVQNANISTSSGSKEIDNIVLQSVKSTLNVVKPPAGEVKTPDFNLILTIYL